jgi:hypothetical protein
MFLNYASGQAQCPLPFSMSHVNWLAVPPRYCPFL